MQTDTCVYIRYAYRQQLQWCLSRCTAHWVSAVRYQDVVAAHCVRPYTASCATLFPFSGSTKTLKERLHIIGTMGDTVCSAVTYFICSMFSELGSFILRLHSSESHVPTVIFYHILQPHSSVIEYYIRTYYT